jgi:hypothetical protein
VGSKSKKIHHGDTKIQPQTSKKAVVMRRLRG